jgi:hypothetical protein
MWAFIVGSFIRLYALAESGLYALAESDEGK